MNACVLSSPDVTAIVLVSAWCNAHFGKMRRTLPQEQNICLSTKIPRGSPPTATISFGYCFQLGMKITRTLIYLRKRGYFCILLLPNEPSSKIRSKKQDHLARSIFPFSLFPRSIQILVFNRPKASDKIWKHLKELGLFKNMILNNLETEHFWVHLNKRKTIFKKFLERVISIHDNHYSVSFWANVICVFENQEYILSSSPKNLQAKTPFSII